MSFRNKFAGIIAVLGLVAMFGGAANAQSAGTSAETARPQIDGMKRARGRHHGGVPVARIMRDLNLTDAQEQQARGIIEQFVKNIEPQRQVLSEMHNQLEVQGSLSDESRQKAQELREQIHTSQKQMQSELMALLTPEQRAQYDQLEEQWKSRRAERHERRGRSQKLPRPEPQ
jgi:Spy/CpxP family protein refolding chaperone